ncbi:MAG: hypothetical protein IRY95_07785, partial [Clostridia bacterium]|nr:hypothetical protein [Clostridia bacterium]
MSAPSGRDRRGRLRRVSLLLGGLALALSGCWSYRDIEDRAVPVAMGVDATPDGFRVAVQVALSGPAPGGATQGAPGGGAGAGKPVWVLTARGSSLEGAFRNLQSRVPRELFWPHVRILVIGDRLARRGLAPVVEALARHPMFRLTTWMAVAPSPVDDLLSVRIPTGNIPANALANLRRLNVSYAPNLKEVWRALEEPGIDPALPLYAAVRAPRGGLDLTAGRPAETVQVRGLALFRGDRLAGELDLLSTRGFLWLTNRMQRSVVTVSCPSRPSASGDQPGRHVAVQVRHGRPSLRVTRGQPGGAPQIRVDLTGVGEIVEMEGCPLDVSRLPD